MRFDEFWEDVAKENSLPNTAIEQIPKTLSERVKIKLSKKEPKEAVQLLNEIIEQINHGSVKSVDELLNDRL